MAISLNLFTPKFLWDRKKADGLLFKHMVNYGRLWRSAVMLTALSAIIPLLTVAWVDYNVTQKAVESENLSGTSRTVSNTKRNISAFPASTTAGWGNFRLVPMTGDVSMILHRKMYLKPCRLPMRSWRSI